MKKSPVYRLLSTAYFSSGETILEVIIAVTVLMLILGPASALYISSTHTIAGNRNDLIAAALAEEGIEMLRNMRDTNLLKFSPKAQECWNTKPDHDTLTDSDAPMTAQSCENSDNKIAGGKYRLTLNPGTLEWNLEVPDDPIPQLSEPPIAAVGDIEEYRLFFDEGGTSFYFIPSAGWSAPPGPDGSPNPPPASFFYRQITVDYLDLAAPAGANSSDPAMRVTSLVQYRRGNGEPRNIKRVLILTNQPS